MPYLITKNKNANTYKVINKITKKVHAYATKDPKKLIQAIEVNKHKNIKKSTRRNTRHK